MSQGLWTFPGITHAKELEYTQALGVRPSIVSMRCIPQATNIAATGTVTITYGVGVLTLPNCLVDSGRIVLDAAHGFLMSIPAFDRRWKWERYPPISGYYNIRRQGVAVVATQKNLQQLMTLLLNAIGETSAVVSAVSTSIYPEVRWNAHAPHLALQELMTEYGYDVALGFGEEPVTIVQRGVGASLNIVGGMLVSSGVDPKTRPQYVRTVFGDSRAQARFKLVAVGKDTDGAWRELDDLSYQPFGGWSAENPYLLPNVQSSQTEATYKLAISTVFRAYRIDKFADGTLNTPDGDGTLGSIEQVLPLENRLLDREYARSAGSAEPFRIFGVFRTTDEYGQPPTVSDTGIDDQIRGRKVVFDGENGMVLFEEPIFQMFGPYVTPAELYLECAFRLHHATTFAPFHYEKDVMVDAGGFGYLTVPYRETSAMTLVSYSAGHVVSSITTNQAELDNIADSVADSASQQFATEGSQMVVYNEPNLSLRCDGAIQQVKHVISDGQNHPGSYSIASRHQEFDVFMLSRHERLAMTSQQIEQVAMRARMAMAHRKEESDD